MKDHCYQQHFTTRLIHSDAGPNVVRSYPVKKNGAGYSADIINILKGEKDQWFRPADVCVAPDGSLIIADWYDPGVGGHQAGDQIREEFTGLHRRKVLHNTIFRTLIILHRWRSCRFAKP